MFLNYIVSILIPHASYMFQPFHPSFYVLNNTQ